MWCRATLLKCGSSYHEHLWTFMNILELIIGLTVYFNQHSLFMNYDENSSWTQLGEFWWNIQRKFMKILELIIGLIEFGEDSWIYIHEHSWINHDCSWIIHQQFHQGYKLSCLTNWTTNCSTFYQFLPLHFQFSFSVCRS